MARDGTKSAQSRSNSTATKSSSGSPSPPKNGADVDKEASKEANKEEAVKKTSRRKNSSTKAKERKGRKSVSSSRPKSVVSEKKEKVTKRSGKSKKRTSTKAKERARSTSSSLAKSELPTKKEKKAEKKKRAKSATKKKSRKSPSRLERKSASRKKSASPPPKKKRAQSRSASSKSRKKSSSTRRRSSAARDKKSLSPQSKKSHGNTAGRGKSVSESPTAHRRTTKRKKSPPTKARRSKSASESKSRSRSRSNKRARNTRGRTPTPDDRSRARNKKRAQSASRRRTNTRSGRSAKRSYSRRRSHRRNERNNRSYRRNRYASRSRGRGRRATDNRRDRSRRRSRSRSHSRSRLRSRRHKSSRSRSRSRSRSHVSQKKRTDKRHQSERRSASSSHGRTKKAPAVVSTTSPVKKRPTRTARSASSSDSGSEKSVSAAGKNNTKDAKRSESVSSEQSSDREIVPMMTPEERLAAALRHIEAHGEMFVRTLEDACETGDVLIRAIEQAGGTTWESGEFVLGYMPKVMKSDGLGGADSTVPTILVLGTMNGDDDGDQEAPLKEKEGETSTVPHFAENEDAGEMTGTGLPEKAFVLAWIHAANAFWAVDDKVGGPPVNVKFVLAKNGKRYNNALSSAAAAVVLEEKEFFKGVDVVVGRGTSWLSEKPTIYLGNRGMRTFEVTISSEEGVTTPRSDAEENDDVQRKKALAPLGIEHAGAVEEPLAELVDLINAFKDSRSVASGIEANVINPPSLDEYKSQVNMQVRGSTAEDALKNRTVRPAVCFHSISAQPCGPFDIPRSASARLSLVSTEWAEDGNALRLLQNLYSGQHTLKVNELQSCRPWGSASASSQFVHKLKDAVTSILPVQLSKIHIAIDGVPSAGIMSSLLNNLNSVPALSFPMSYRASKEPALSVMAFLDYTKILATFIDRVGDKKIIL